jgi:mercuric ion binding protein
MNKLARAIAITGVLGVLVAVATFTRTTETPVLAATKTVTLSVPGMTCESCPITVKTALTRVEGVGKVEASLEHKEAIVTFDEAKTKVEALLDATKNAGYPSTVKP